MEKRFTLESLINAARTFLQAILGPAANPETGDEYGKMEDVTSIENLPPLLTSINQKYLIDL